MAFGGKVAVYFAPGNARSKLVGEAMARGMQAIGQPYELRSSRLYNGRPDCDVILFYGLSDGLRRIFDDYRGAGRKALYVDLGYWGRRKRTRWDGYHKIALNDRHPTRYFQDKRHDAARFNDLGITIQPWRPEGRHIIVAGMSAKAAAAEGLQAETWEKAAIAKLRSLTRRPIIYRPKPNWPGARRISGASMDCETPLEIALRDCHAVVARHSNVAVDALVAGVPVFCDAGVASVLGSGRLANIETPLMPKGRAQWAYDLAHVQYTMDEMANGVMWRYLESDGLL